jgi:hypothetical protein
MPRRRQGPRKKAQVTVVFPQPEELERLEEVARRKHVPISILMRMVIGEYVDNELDSSRQQRPATGPAQS